MRVGLGGAVTVTATERWLSELRAGRAFLRGATQTAVAAQFSHVQIRNPAASGVILLVRQIYASSAAAMAVALADRDAVLGGGANLGFNLLKGAAAGLGEVRTEANAAQLGTAHASFDLPAGQLTPLIPEWGYELGAGEGVLVFGGTVNVQLSVTYFWVEL